MSAVNRLRELLRVARLGVRPSGVERIQASAHAGALLRHPHDLTSSVIATGVYGYTCRSPVEHLRAEVIDLRKALVLAIQSRAWALVDRLRQDIDRIPTQVAWQALARNTVTTVGKNHLLDTEFAGSSYTAAWYLGLISDSGYSAISAGDTMSSHAGWTEATAYAESTRVALSWNSASSGSKASTTTSFSINANATTIKGGFNTTGSAKSGTTGTLYSAGLFIGGDEVADSGDTLDVTYTASA